MNPKLQEAVAIFKSLGWERATPENVMSLPLPTGEQKKTALEGLKSGEFGTIGEVGKNAFGWISGVDVNESMLALFAVRTGVNAQRAASILRGGSSTLIAKVIASRSAKYAADFIGFVCVSSRRAWEHSASAYGAAAVRLVDMLNLDVPQNVQYMKDWSVYAAAAMGLKAETFYKETDLPDLELIEKRFIEHVRVGVAVSVPATGPFGAVLPAGVKRGWLPRKQAITLVFSALEVAVRPADRKVWLTVLDELEVGDAEFNLRAQGLIPLLASGEPFVVMRLAPVLIVNADGRLLIEVLLSSFSAASKKAKRLVLKAALDRSRPEGAEELAAWLSILCGDKDKSVASLAARLTDKWAIRPDALPEETPEPQGLWQETPPVWQASGFDLGEISPETLTELAANIVNRPAPVHDVLAERFLAVANAIAHQNPEAARTSLRGLRLGDDQLLNYVVCWVKKETPHYGADDDKHTIPPLDARDYSVCLHLGEQPCLLSTPSRVDLTITVPDLAARLELYKHAGVDVVEADLYLALTRLEASTNTPQAAKALSKLDIPIVLQSGKKMAVTAGRTVLAYLDDHIKEPELEVGRYQYWGAEKISVSKSLSPFPDRLAHCYQNELFAVFPLWGDAGLHAVHWSEDVYHEQGLALRQVARRAAPLPRGATINFLAAQRSMTPNAAEDSALAVAEAWERGLLRPGIADVSLLDWSAKPPVNLAALAAALDGIAQDNMLSVVWPILDSLIVTSLNAPRLLAGTAELAELILAFLPEVQLAIKQGLAEPAALDLPGIRTLAERSGSSRAAEAAKKVAKLLPPLRADAPKEKNVPLEPPFDEIWPARGQAAVLIDDGVTITVTEAPQVYAGRKWFLFTLTLPDIHDHIFHVVKGNWHYDLDSEGQCQAYAAAPGSKVFKGEKENQVWLHWDAEQNRMVVSKFRNWSKESDGPLRGDATPLTASLLTILIGLLAQDGDAVYFAPRLLKEFIGNGIVEAKVLRKAMRVLLQSPAVSPAKLVRALEKDVRLLSVLWPMLIECVKAAGAKFAASEVLPVWINRVLDIALRYATYWAEAARRGIIPSEDARWPGLSEIAAAKVKSAAVGKAKQLLERL